MPVRSPFISKEIRQHFITEQFIKENESESISQKFLETKKEEACSLQKTPSQGIRRLEETEKEEVSRC